MGELRKDYILNRYVIIATERAKRPDQFVHPPLEHKDAKDFFAPGNENLTPPEIDRVEKDGQWQIRVFPNKFAAAEARGNSDVRTDNDFFTFSDAYGYHEVVVESPDANKQLADLSVEELKDVFDMYCKRIAALSEKKGVKYVLVFKNSGDKAGTSIVHTHSQIIAYNIVPTIIEEKENVCAQFASDPYSRIIDIEKGSDRRCFENNSFVSFTPYASRFPFEIVLFPKRFVMKPNELSDEERFDCVSILSSVLKRLQTLHAPYNFYLHYGVRHMRFHIEVTPRLTTHAGFELGSETIINPVPPEDAAKFYRGE